MPVGSGTETSESNVTVTVSDTTGGGGSTQFVDIVVTVDPGKVQPAAAPVGYTEYDAAKLSVWWHNVEIGPNGRISKSFDVQRLTGPQYEGPVEVVTIVTDKAGTYFDVQRSCLCEKSALLRLTSSLLGRIRKAVIGALEDGGKSVT